MALAPHRGGGAVVGSCLVEGREDVVGELDLRDGRLAHAGVADGKARNALAPMAAST